MLNFLFLCSCLALTVASRNDSIDSPNLHRKPRSYGNLKWKDSTPSRSDYSGDFNEFDWDFYANSKPSRVDDYSGSAEFQAPWTGVAFPNSDKQLDMTSLMTKLSGLAIKKEQQSFLGGLFSDPKSVVTSAAVPLVVLLFAVLPYLSSRFSSLMGVQEVVSTVASSRLGHVLSDPQLVESLVMDLAAFASRTLKEEDDSCLQKATCEMVVKNGAAKTVVRTVRRFCRESWLKTLGVNRMITALEKGDCRNLCNRTGSKSNSRRKH